MNAAQITETHQRLTRLWHVQPPAVEGAGFMAAVVENHRHNFLIWHEEDLARRGDLPAERIREAKRVIDWHNQLRNDAIEAIDAALLALLPPPAADAPRHSESPGMILDRLSIMALREYHLEEETTRRDASTKHLTAAAEKLGFVREQREWLTRCLEEILNAPEGRRYFPFRACKLYNDPATNPQLYAPGTPASRRWRPEVVPTAAEPGGHDDRPPAREGPLLCRT